jgi:hypothetical protein
MTDDDLDRPVWGAHEIAQIVNLTRKQAFRLLEQGHLDATKLGGKWVSTRRRLLARIAGER